jgi:hypothetical protein
MAMKTRPGRDSGGNPRAVTSVADGEHVKGRERRMIVLGVEAATLTRYLRSSRFREQVTVGVIVLAALRHMSRESRARAASRLATWDRWQKRRQHAVT